MEPEDESISRRAVLGLGLGAVAAIGLGGCSDDAGGSARDDRSASVSEDDSGAGGGEGRVVVVGAGLAGLTAALDLTEAGWEVVVLEAAERVGGRVRTERESFGEGLHAEAGGESIDVDHAAVLAMLERFGLATEDRPPAKLLDGVTWFRGTRRPTAAFVAEDGGAVAADYARFSAALDALAEGIDPEHPEDAADAEALDARSAQDLIDELALGDEARFLVETDVRSGYNADPAELSLLFLAQQAAASGDVPDDGVEAMRVAGGNDRLPQAMAEELAVTLGTPVERVTWTDDGVQVGAGGETWSASRLVVAVPFPALRAVRFDPPLPDGLRGAVEGLELGPAAKVTVEYERPFWADEGGSGFTVADEPFGVAWSPTDSYTPASGRALLTAFVTGPAAERAAGQSPEDRIADVRGQLDTVYPEGAALATGAEATIAWADERYAGGGYAAYTPGQLAAFWPAIRRGVGPIRFAGEHTESLAGYMESAIRSGHRIAAEIGPPPS